MLELRTRRAFPEQWADTLTSLAIAFLNRIEGARVDNIEQAILLHNQALEVFTPSTYPLKWAITQNYLANAYSFRIKGERADNLEQAILFCHKALEILTRSNFPKQWAASQNILGTVYSLRIEGERTDNLEKAIFHFQKALEVRTHSDSPSDWAITHNNLGNTYAVRIAGVSADNLEQAIFHYHQALKVRTPSTTPEEWAGTQINLGTAFRDRIKDDRAGNLEQAIFHCLKALEVFTRLDFPEKWAATQSDLATIYQKRIKGDPADNLERAIFYCQQALEVYTQRAFPEQWAVVKNNLGFFYSLRMKGVPTDNLEQAIFHYRKALEVRTLERFPSDTLQTVRNLGNLCFKEGRWEEAEAAFHVAIEAGQLLLEEAFTETGQLAEIGETTRLYARDAYCLLKLHQPSKALQQLEHGKTRLMAEAMAIAGADLSVLSEAQQQDINIFRQAIRTLRAEMQCPLNTPGRRSNRDLADDMHIARTSLKDLIARVQVENPEFMAPGLDVEKMLALIPRGGALVAPLVTLHGSALFIIPHGTLTLRDEHILWIDEFNEDHLQTLLFGTDSQPGWLGAYVEYRNAVAFCLQIKRDAETGKANSKVLSEALTDLKNVAEQWNATINLTTGQLWNELMAPVYHRLKTLCCPENAPVLLIPQAGLGLLPLHAAWRPIKPVPMRDESEDQSTRCARRYFLDDFTLTYAPSCYAQSICQCRIRETHRQHRSLLAVVNPMKDLYFVPAECEAISAFFDQGSVQMLAEDEASAEAVKTAVIGKSYVHFSSHGFYDWQEAMRSGLVLAGGIPLTLADIIVNIDLSTSRLVTLSACETGLTEFRRSPDEYLGLSAGFLQGGAPGVVSTLWAIDDFSTMLLMERFYENHLKGEMEIAEALCQAQLWLRDVSVGELRAKFSEEWQTLISKTRIPSEAMIKQFHRFDQSDPEERPYAHPHYWAAFTFYGL